ncbi:hypothetical protein Pth03_11510 [Planotetraspora thailandica]|uniref:Transposase IS4-like domain-containing protein n=1 Tax=Planotetraspora thailandica TaxID=487172 RepID=A0A8J3XS38_9ACTN|nr:hypothetical protein [Planotetraspora thailandica]GII52762.1 hypothetical protein Pth03_11510 [Planotetraspora thailandica]
MATLRNIAIGALRLTGTDGSRVHDRYRLITTLLDHRRYPALEVVSLYHERWEIEIAYLALRHTLLNGHVLHSGDRPGLEQEIWALLTLYQLPRMAMVTAVETCPGTNPDRASFTTALETARDQLAAARGICPDGPVDLLGAIGRGILHALLSARRPRYSARKVKCATSRFLNRDDGRPHNSTTITAIDIALHTPPLELSAHRRIRSRGTSSPPPVPDPPAARHGDRDHRPARELAGQSACRTTRDQAPEPPDSAGRMGPPGLPHPDRRRDLHAYRAAVDPGQPCQSPNYEALDREATQ